MAQTLDPNARHACLGIAFIAGLAGAFPDAYLAPLATSSTSSPPSWGFHLIRSASLLIVLVFGGAGLAWRRFHNAWQRALDRLVGVAPYRYWTGIAFLGLLARCWVAWAVPYEPTSDAAWYGEVARSIADGHGVSFDGAPTAYRGPAYPALLAGPYWIFGSNPGLAWIWGAVASVAIVVSMHALARRWYGEAAARLAGIAGSVYPAFVVMSGQVMSDLVFTAALWVLVALALRTQESGLRWFVLAGAWCGLLTLTRGVAVGLFLLVPMLGAIRERTHKRVLIACILSAAGMAAVVLPWMLRNQSQLGTFALYTNVGVNLYIGNRSNATGGYEIPAAVEAVGEASRSTAYLDRAVQSIQIEPLQSLLRLPKKLAHLLLLELSFVDGLVGGMNRPSRATTYFLYGLSQFAYMSVLALVLVGGAATPRGRADLAAGAAGWIVCAYLGAITLVFFGDARFRLPIMPMLLIGATAVLASWGRGNGQPSP